MAWLAVNENGCETISPEKPDRSWGGRWIYSEEVYCEGDSTCVSFTVEIPNGLIFKIIDRSLAWEDDPVEIK